MGTFQMGFEEFTEIRKLNIDYKLTPLIAVLDDGRILKQTGDKAEMFFNGDLAYIIIEKITPITELKHSEIFIKLNNLIKIKVILYFIVYYMTFKKVKLNIRKMFFDKNMRSWVDRAVNIKEECHKQGIKNPSDYFSLGNLGLKNGQIAAFDIRDEKDFFYDMLK
jgi:hypothetical protein